MFQQEAGEEKKDETKSKKKKKKKETTEAPATVKVRSISYFLLSKMSVAVVFNIYSQKISFITFF